MITPYQNMTDGVCRVMRVIGLYFYTSYLINQRGQVKDGEQQCVDRHSVHIHRDQHAQLHPRGQAWHEIIHGECSLRSQDRKSTRLNSSHVRISYAVFCLKKKNKKTNKNIKKKRKKTKENT